MLEYMGVDYDRSCIDKGILATEVLRASVGCKETAVTPRGLETAEDQTGGDGAEQQGATTRVGRRKRRRGES